MSSSRIAALRRSYHQRICKDVLRVNGNGFPNNADSGSAASVSIGKGIIERIGIEVRVGSLPGQTAGRLFEVATKEFLCDAFALLQHIRPGEWEFSLGGNIGEFDQYRHLKDVRQAIADNKDLLVAFGDYIVKPDIVVSRRPVSDRIINAKDVLVGAERVSSLTPLRAANADANILHASVSCKWTIRSDRSQNARTEGLNLMRNRKGGTPRIVVAVGEPLPARIASLAFGTGDIDCVYHFALPELVDSISDSEKDLLRTLIDGKRLRDISDLPFDLAI